MSTLGKRKVREVQLASHGSAISPDSHPSSLTSQDQRPTLFISNLPYTATSTDLKTLFSDIAPVRNAFVVLEQSSGASKGVGYVSFAIKEDAQLALTKISTEGLAIDGRSIRAEWADNKPKPGDTVPEPKPRLVSKHPAVHSPKDPLAIRTVVISGLSPSVDAKSLWKKVRKYEGAEKVEWPLKINDGPDDPTSARALFTTAAYAQDATQRLHAHIFKGSMISATLKKRLDGFQKTPTAPVSQSKSMETPSRASRLIIRNLPFDIKEDDIMATFLPHGPVHSIDMPKSEDGRAKRFAFVWMLSKKDAEKAVEKCNGMKIRAGITEELAQMKQKKKKQVREEKKGKFGGDDKEEGEDAKGGERVIAVDWALSKDKWEEERAKTEKDVSMSEADEESEEEEAIGVNEDIDDSDEDSSRDGDEDQPKSGKPELPPPESGTTLFVRNLPFEATDDELRLLFRAFGPLRYARITRDADTGRSRGTGFVCFWEIGDADKAVEKSEILRLETTGTNEAAKPNPFKLPTLLTPDPSSSLAQNLVLHGRTLDVVRAVTRNEATKLKEEGEKRREKADKRNLYLLREGVILPNTEAAEILLPVEVEKRTQSFNTRRALLKGNPSLYVSRTRLSIRQLPTAVTEHMIKRLANYAIKEFEQEVKRGDRMGLDAEELRDEDEEPIKKRNASRKVKQAKVIRQHDKVDPVTGKGRSRGYGFLELHEHADALRVLRWANNNTQLAPLWEKWWKDEAAELIKKEKGAVKEGTNKDEAKDEKENRIKRLEEALKKDGGGNWNARGSLIVEFSIENVQVTQRRKQRESGTDRTDPHEKAHLKVAESERPFKKRKVSDAHEGQIPAGRTKDPKQTPNTIASPTRLGSLIGRKRKQKKARS